MSVQAITWVLEDAPDLPAHLVGTLLGLANHADRHGRGAYVSQNLLGWYARKARRNIRKDIDDLLKLGLIREGDQRLAEHIRADRRPVVYDLAIERKRDRASLDEGMPASPRKASTRGRTHPPADAPRGDAQCRHGGMQASPKPSTEPTSSSSALPKPVAAIADALSIEEEEAQKVFDRIVAERRPAAPSRYIAALIDSGDIRGFHTRARDSPPPYTGPRCTYADAGDGTGLCATCSLPAAHARHGGTP